MGGLTPLAFLFVAWCAAASPVTPHPAAQHGRDARHLERVRALLAEPRPQDAYWRNTTFQSITRLEHAPVEEILPAWSLLAQDGPPRAQANLVLYRRRHGLPLGEAPLTGDAGVLLEHALAAQGDGDAARAERLFRAGVARHPEDDRFRSNLLWLRGEAPEALRADGGARAFAHAVLAARSALD